MMANRQRDADSPFQVDSVVLDPLTADPTYTQDGQFWYRGDIQKVFLNKGGVIGEFGAGGAITIGAEVVGGNPLSVLFIDSSGDLAQDGNFLYDPGTSVLTVQNLTVNASTIVAPNFFDKDILFVNAGVIQGTSGSLQWDTALGRLIAGGDIQAGNRIGIGDLDASPSFMVDSSGGIVRMNNLNYAFPGTHPPTSPTGVPYALSQVDNTGNLLWVQYLYSTTGINNGAFVYFNDPLSAEPGVGFANNLQYDSTLGQAVLTNGGPLYFTDLNPYTAIKAILELSSLQLSNNPYITFWSGTFLGDGTQTFEIQSDGNIYNIKGLAGYNWPTSHTSGVWKNNGSGTISFGQVSLVDGSDDITGTLSTSNGGTGLSTYVQGDLLFKDLGGSPTLSVLAKNTTFARYLSNTGTNNNPTWAQVDLASGVTNKLAAVNGGTGFGSYVLGDILYANSTTTLAALAADTVGVKFLSNQGVGNIPKWETVPGGVGGSDTQVQFNDMGTLAGDGGLTWNKTEDKLVILSDGTVSFDVKLAAYNRSIFQVNCNADGSVRINAGANAGVVTQIFGSTGTLIDGSNTSLFLCSTIGQTLYVGQTGYWILADSTKVVINDNAANLDFIVEGDTDPNLLVTDASADRVGIGIALPISKLDVRAVGAGPRIVLGDAVAQWKLGIGAETIPYLYIGGGTVTTEWFWRANWNATADPVNTFKSPTATVGQVVLAIDGAASQTANLLNLRNSSASILALINKDGGFVFNEQGLDTDCRIEGDNDPDLVHTDASTDSIGFGVSVPSAFVHLKAGTSSRAPFMLTSGTNLSSAAAGALEYDGTLLTFTNGSTNRFNVGLTTTPLSAYSAGTAYALTATPALLDFGTTDPSITIDKAGTYMLKAYARVDYNAATHAANRTITLKMRRTNNTPADLTNGTRAVLTETTTTLSKTFATPSWETVYTTSNADDIIQIFGSIDTVPTVGSDDVVEAYVLAVRLY